MRTPAWIITGLLDSGKTTLINRLLKEELNERDVLVIQFESGDEPLRDDSRIQKLVFLKSQLEQRSLDTADRILEYLEEHNPDLILVEWNGMEHFHKLEEMLLQFTAAAMVSVEKVIYAADEAAMQHRIPDAGAAAFSQIAGSDCAYLRTREQRPANIAKEASLLYRCNPDIRVFSDRKWDRFVREMFHFNARPGHWLLLILSLALFCRMALPLFEDFGVPVGRYVSIFLGVFLQAVPFLAIGVLLSSAIQVYVSPDWIQRKFPEKVLTGQLFAVLAGFCLPVCDCASIPVFKSLVKKGVPLPAAVTFMLVSPVINPVVILSTWYAFNGNSRMIAARCGLGILCAVICGLTYLVRPPEDYLLDRAVPFSAGCGDYALPAAEKNTRAARFSMMLRHAQNEFFAVGKYLLTGILVSTIFQDFLPSAVAAGGGAVPWKALVLMMGLAFILSLCSSSDAVVARSMAGSLPAGPLIGFLVFGPMMDIKNAAMLRSGFQTRFVVRLAVTAFLVCFIVIALFMLCGSGGIRI